MPASRCCCCMAAGRRATPGAAPPSISRARARLAYALDQRGHGDSRMGRGRALCVRGFRRRCGGGRRARLTQRSGKRPIAIGASLGGIASLLAEGKAERAGHGPLFAAIVLVDITPRVDRERRRKIQGFMRERAAEGFADRRRSRRRGRRLPAASQAPALARRAAQELAAASRTGAGAGTGTRACSRASARSRRTTACSKPR